MLTSDGDLRRRAALTHSAHFVLAGVFAFCFSWGLASLWLPLGWDHGMMISVGEAMARGGLPYVDAWDQKGPLAYVPYALSVLLFGHVMWGIRIIELVILIPALYLFYRVVAELTNFVIGAGTALALYLWLASAGWFNTAQPEVWVTALTAVTVCLVLKPSVARSPKVGTFLVIGLLLGCAGLFKPHFLLFGLAPLVFLMVNADLPQAQRVRLAGGLAAGAILPIVIVVAYLTARGGFPAFVEAYSSLQPRHLWRSRLDAQPERQKSYPGCVWILLARSGVRDSAVRCCGSLGATSRTCDRVTTARVAGRGVPWRTIPGQAFYVPLVPAFSAASCLRCVRRACVNSSRTRGPRGNSRCGRIGPRLREPGGAVARPGCVPMDETARRQVPGRLL